MSKIISRIIDIFLIIIVIIMMIAAYGNISSNKPLFMSSIRSNSMYPLFERGDIIFLESLSIDSQKNIGDIVVFRDMEGELSTKGYIVHRLYSGDMIDGFATKGDNNDDTDQNLGDVPLIQNDWIYSKVITFNDKPIKIPYLGYISLYFIENDLSNQLPALIAIVVLLIIGVESVKFFFKEKQSKRMKRKKKRRGTSGFDFIIPSIIFLSLGLTISILTLAASFKMGNMKLIEYKVVNQNNVTNNSTLIISQYDDYHGELFYQRNNGIFPMYVQAYINNNKVTLTSNHAVIKPQKAVKINFTLDTQELGTFESKVYVATYFPLLPPQLIEYMSQRGMWPTTILLSIIPGLPLYLYPFFHPTHRHNLKRFYDTVISK